MSQAIPARIVAGDTASWTVSLADYPASAGWVLKYRLINAAGKIDITATADGDDHRVSEPAATTATWPPGAYTRQAYVERAGERHTVATGNITIAPDLAAQPAGYDTRSAARQTLDALDAAMAAHGANAWTQEYEISGRRMRFRTPGEFLAFRDRMRAEVAREEAAARLAAGLPSRSRVYVRF